MTRPRTSLDPWARAWEQLSARLRGRWLGWSLLGGVTVLALALNTWGLSEAGYGNTYYAAAVRSMTVSWKNFFFGAFDPGGFITVDKPPAFLWVGALSARLFGFSSWSILLPSAFAGAASVALLWVIVRKWFGLTAATIAALVLALSPISVAVNRLNLPEPFMVLLLVGAAGCVMQSLQARRWWLWTAAAGALVGVAFNTKMGAAWIPGPAFALAIVVGAPAIARANIKQTAIRLVLLATVTLVVSGSWVAIVDAWPASDRPYVGGSTDNTELNLVFGYNGFGRVDGDSQGGGGGGGGTRFNRNNGGGPAGGASLGAGGVIAGLPGPFRMFDAANGGQIGWLLPFALGGALLAAWQWRSDPTKRAFAVLFGGWVLLYGGMFSYAEGIYHSYYTSAMAPGVAALVGVGAVAAGSLVRKDARWLIAIGGLVAVTLYAQLHIEARTPDFWGWLRPLTVLAAIGGVVLLAFLAQRKLSVAAGLAMMVGALLILPGAWSISEAANAPLNTTLPQAGPRAGTSGQTFGSQAFDGSTSSLAAWLKANNDPNATWQLVVSNAMGASTLIGQDGISVLPLGGFLGTDPTITVSQFAGLVAGGDVRYVQVSGFGGRGTFGGRPTIPNGNFPGGRAFPGGGTFVPNQPPTGAPPQIATSDATKGATPVLTAVQSTCTVVTDPTLPTAYEGQIYDCSSHAEALRALG
ncbi:MAG: glycosyltransferase family 39 protein [Chloroflexota bacterium]